MLLRLNVPRHRTQFIREKPLLKQSSGPAVTVVERMDAHKHSMDERGIIEGFFHREIRTQKLVNIIPELVHFPLHQKGWCRFKLNAAGFVFHDHHGVLPVNTAPMFRQKMLGNELVSLRKMTAGESVFFRINVGSEEIVRLFGELGQVFYVLDFVLDITVDFHRFALNFGGSDDGYGGVKVKGVRPDECFTQLP